MKRILTSTCLLAGVAVAEGGIAYDTLGPGDDFQTLAWLIGEPSFDQKVAMTFQAWQGGRLSTITLALTHYAFDNVYDITLYTDNCGRPGAVLEAWLGVATPPSALLELTSIATVDLTIGYNYWVEVRAPLGGDQTVGGWNYDVLPSNNTDFVFALGAGAYAEQCGERSALRVETTGGGSSTCPGDFDGNGIVDITDLALLLSAFGTMCP